ncbi:putative T7SS-secreted protein [Nocardioides sp. GCM10027113]|uniref:putative T7SS-secreted protein n=1 Tax=unclassified Nocardioides TaxID=2615069 RepID=UPI003606088E
MTAPPSRELGETLDPRQLVPGDPGHVDANVAALRREHTRIGDRYDLVRSVAVPGWTGLTAWAYEAAHDAELTRWKAMLSLLEQAASALATYAAALRGAQAQAQVAIDRWEEGERATRGAVAAHNAAVQAWNTAACAPAPSHSPFGGLPVPVLRPAPPGPFIDPGESVREEARQVLAQARAGLEEAGQAALVALGGLEGARTEGDADVLGADASAEGPSFSWRSWEDTFGRDPATGRDGSYDDRHDGGPFKISLGHVEGQAWVARAEGSWEDYWGPVRVNADGSVTILAASGEAEATIDGDGVRVNAEATATAVRLEGSTGLEGGHAEVGLAGDAFAGGTAGGHFVADRTGLHAGGEVFAGGRAGVDLEGDVGGVGGGVTAEGWAGFGLAGDVDLGWDDGAFTVGGSGGLAFGLGGKVGGEVTLDFPEIWETGGDVVEGIGSWLD